MRAIKGLILPLLLLAGQPAKAATLHTVLLIDTHASMIGPMTVTNRDTFNSILRSGFRKAPRGYRLNLTVLEGQNLTPNAVFRVIDQIRWRSGDSILCYYSGHGSMDHGNRHILNMRYGNIARSDLRGALCANAQRPVILITDSCFALPQRKATVNKTITPQHTPNWMAFQKLFFQSKGLVDVNSASPGGVSYIDQRLGGYYTWGFLSALYGQKPDPSCTWQKLLATADQNVAKVIGNRQRSWTFFLNQTPTQYYERRLHLVNEGTKTVWVSVWYFTHCSDGWRWVESSNPWTVAPRASGTLTDQHGRVSLDVRGQKVQIRTKTSDGRAYLQSLELVHPRRGYAASRLEAYSVRLPN